MDRLDRLVIIAAGLSAAAEEWEPLAGLAAKANETLRALEAIEAERQHADE